MRVLEEMSENLPMALDFIDLLTAVKMSFTKFGVDRLKGCGENVGKQSDNVSALIDLKIQDDHLNINRVLHTYSCHIYIEGQDQTYCPVLVPRRSKISHHWYENIVAT